MTIGKRIRQLRENRGLSQAKVERLTGIKRTYLSHLENGSKNHDNPTYKTLIKLATVFWPENSNHVALSKLFATDR